MVSGEVIRPREVLAAAGGKGFNVARAVVRLGGQASCAALLGGNNGRFVAELAEKEGLPGKWTLLDGETRICTILITDENEVFEVYEAGIPITVADWSRFVVDVVSAAQSASVVCLSGSVPKSSPSTAPADLIEAIRNAGRRVWIDTSGAALEAALAVRPHGLKVNATEIGELLGQPGITPPQAAAIAHSVLERGVERVVLTLGKDGAVAASAEGTWIVDPPTVPTGAQIVSAVGSGDSFLAGLVSSLESGAALPEALKRGVAAGTANALCAGAAQFDLERFRQVLDSLSVRPVSD